ncbi:hypothetical protein L9F63_014329, partial [Diploptera punctata]
PTSTGGTREQPDNGYNYNRPTSDNRFSGRPTSTGGTRDQPSTDNSYNYNRPDNRFSGRPTSTGGTTGTSTGGPGADYGDSGHRLVLQLLEDHLENKDVLQETDTIMKNLPNHSHHHKVKQPLPQVALSTNPTESWSLMSLSKDYYSVV